MKKYLVFQFDSYYPSGGWNDFVGTFDTIEECLVAWQATECTCQFYQIVSTATMQVVQEN